MTEQVYRQSMTRTGVSAKYEPNKCIGKVCSAFTARRLVDLDLGAPCSLSRRSVGPSKPLRSELPSCGHCYAKLPRREACESPVRLDVFRSNTNARVPRLVNRVLKAPAQYKCRGKCRRKRYKCSGTTASNTRLTDPLDMYDTRARVGAATRTSPYAACKAICTFPILEIASGNDR